MYYELFRCLLPDTMYYVGWIVNIGTMYMENVYLKICYGCLKENHKDTWQKTILIFAGGLGGFGLELADWLVLQGARKLVLSSRTGVRTGYQSLRMKVWCSHGATVVISLADITTESGVRDLLSDANRLGQVDAIFNLAMVSVMLLCVCKVCDHLSMKQ